MSRFAVLDRSLDIHQPYLLEASAGTGKTFSVENVVARLLMEQPTLSLDEILLVTFTREATRDLSRRIRSHLRRLYEGEGDLPDYFLAQVEGGRGEAVRRHLQQALYCFDDAQIFTIHSFCARMLAIYRGERRNDEPFSRKEVIQHLHNFFRAGMTDDGLNVWQLERLLQEFRTLERLEQNLAGLIEKGLAFAPVMSNRELEEELRRLKQHVPGDLEAKLREYEPLFRKPSGKETVDEWRRRGEAFLQLFSSDKDLFPRFCRWGDVWSRRFDPALLKKGKEVAIDPFWEEVWMPLWRQAAHPSHLLARIGSAAQDHLTRVVQAEKRGFYDDWLKETLSLIEDDAQCRAIRGRYRAVIVDEFQDTDPLQWSIFSHLFPPKGEWGSLYLVGDPKQSIYAFRRADIYTYLDAGKAMGADHHADLDTNFRSTPQLIDALNALFAEENAPGWMALPREASSLRYPPVHAGKTEPSTLKDGRAALHFFLVEAKEKRKGSFPLQQVEEEAFFPAIVNEIVSLGVPYPDIAILVRDRYQAARMASYLEALNIPTKTIQRELLADSPAWEAVRRVLMATLHPHNLSYVKSALSSCLIGWKESDLLALEDDRDARAHVVFLWMTLQKTFLRQGVASFFQLFWQTCWIKGAPARQHLLRKEKGAERLRDAEQIGLQFINHATIESFLAEMDFEEEQQQVMKAPDPSEEGVLIQTIHSSKGLEYRIVFGLGAIVPTPQKPLLFPSREGILVPAGSEQEGDYQLFCKENDAEKMRQFYVLCTRAKERLYLPAVALERKVPPESGSASPMDLFLARFRRPLATMEEVYERLLSLDLTPLQIFLDEHSLTYTRFEEPLPTPATAKKALTKQQTIFPPEPLSFSFETRERVSFSRLVTSIPPKEEAKAPPEGILPQGAETGLYLHTILEKMSFQRFSSPEEIRFPVVEKFEPWTEDVATILFHTMNQSLGIEGFCLGDLTEAEMIREGEFFFQDPLPEGGERTYQGVIDLVFTFEGNDYLVDWKTNWLASYDREAMEKEMQRHRYDFQASIYAEAWRRMTSRRITKAFYLFLRGLDDGGVYAFDPEEWR